LIDLFSFFIRSLPDSVSPHYVELKHSIDEQKERIQRLEDREIDYQDELKRREQLILDLQHEVISLQESYDASTRELRAFAHSVDEAHRYLSEETEMIGSLIIKSTKTIASLQTAFLESSHTTITHLDGKYFKTLQFSPTETSSNLPILTIHKISCAALPPSTDPLSSISPYIVVSLGDCSAQTPPIRDTRSGGPLEWTSSNQNLQLVTNISTDDLITVEIWDQFALHEAHLLAKGTGRIISTEHAASDWRLGNDCDSEITLQLFDDKANPLNQTITLVGSLKNNLYHHPNPSAQSVELETNPKTELINEEEIKKYLNSLENSLVTLDVQQVASLHYFPLTRRLLESICDFVPCLLEIADDCSPLYQIRLCEHSKDSRNFDELSSIDFSQPSQFDSAL
jgi:hypothetical protein